MITLHCIKACQVKVVSITIKFKLIVMHIIRSTQLWRYLCKRNNNINMYFKYK
jgi:hypothetical protein